MAPASPVLTCLVSVILAFSFCVDGSNETEPAAAVQSTAEVVKKLEEALKAAQDGLKNLESDDDHAFFKSLWDTTGTLAPWSEALATAFQLIPPLVNPTPPSDQDLKILKAAIAKLNEFFLGIRAKNFGLDTPPVNQYSLAELQKQEIKYYDFAAGYDFFSSNPLTVATFQKLCDTQNQGINEILWLLREITKPDFGPILEDYFEDSCNYTEILYRSRRVATLYMLLSQLSSSCEGINTPKSKAQSQIQAPDSNKGVERFSGKSLDQFWAEMAAKLYATLQKKKTFRNCLPVFMDSLESFSKKNENRELGHEKFANGLASHLFGKFPWINWYVLSYDEGIGGFDAHFCIGGILSHCIQRKYGRNLFVAGQQAEDNYFYNKNCPAVKECVKKLEQYKNCEDATKPFEQCITEKCKRPAGTFCKKSSDGFAAEKGKSASSDGWSKANFGTDKKYSMHVVSP